MIGASSVTKPHGLHSLTFVQDSDDEKFMRGECVATLQRLSNTTHLQNLGVSPSCNHSSSAPAAVTSDTAHPSSCRLPFCRLLPPWRREIATAYVPIHAQVRSVIAMNSSRGTRLVDGTFR